MNSCSRQTWVGALKVRQVPGLAPAHRGRGFPGCHARQILRWRVCPLSAGAQTQLRLAVEVNGMKVKAGQHPAQHCQMFSFNKVLYGYENSKIFAAKRGRNPD